MRILSVTLIALAAFLLGLAVAGHMPREAAAQAVSQEAAPAVSPGFDWKADGKTVTFVNKTTLVPYLAQIRFKKGAKVPSVPTRSTGELRVPQADVDQIYFYRLEGAIFSGSGSSSGSSSGTRAAVAFRFRGPCEPPGSVAGCPIPGPIPIGIRELTASVVPRQR